MVRSASLATKSFSKLSGLTVRSARLDKDCATRLNQSNSPQLYSGEAPDPNARDSDGNTALSLQKLIAIFRLCEC